MSANHQPDLPKPSLIRTLVAVLWSFFGVRSRKEFNRDMAQINPIHLMVVGLVLAIAFVALLVVLVNWIVRQPMTL
jgi:hypothetical protein